jgi:hypothetical protein
MNMRASFLLLGAAFITCASQVKADDIVLTVGPDGQYQRIGDAVADADADTDASNYYDIRVAPGNYINDFSEVTRPMTIEVDPSKAGQQVVLQATVPLPNQKGIILAFASLRVSGLTFTGAYIANGLGGNGAGIRDQIGVFDQTPIPASLIVENSTFIGNQEGILTGYNFAETVTIINSKFKNNGNPDISYFQHALYVGGAGSLTVINSLFCGQLIGHNIKSRAVVTTIANNWIYDGEADPAEDCGAGSSSYAIEVSEGGVVSISGNQIIQGPATQNSGMVGYGAEGLSYSNNSLLVADNLFLNTSPNAIGVNDFPCLPAVLINNTFQRVNTPVYPPECAVYSLGSKVINFRPVSVRSVIGVGRPGTGP